MTRLDSKLADKKKKVVVSYHCLKENTEPAGEMGGLILGFRGGWIKENTLYV